MSWDVIVLGLGGIGSATSYHLSRRGLRVLGLDAWPRLHTRGSSHGQSRTIRRVYWKTDYVPLVLRAYELWQELEAAVGRQLLKVNGGLLIADPQGHSLASMRQTATTLGLPYDEHPAPEANRRWPALRIPDWLQTLYDPAAGVLNPEAGVAAHLDLAVANGATHHFDEPVYTWGADGSGFRVTTKRATHHAGRLVLTPGPWASQLIGGLGRVLTTYRVVNVGFRVAGTLTRDRIPYLMLHLPRGNYYVVPGSPDEGLKIGRHNGLEPCDPDRLEREVQPSEVHSLQNVLRSYLAPNTVHDALHTTTCIYTHTPDEDFIVDRHPDHKGVVMGVGFSGHGFKFAPVIGDMLADLATNGHTRYNNAFLASSRTTLLERTTTTHEASDR